MVVFNPETNPGQFALNRDESMLALTGLESMVLGPDDDQAPHPYEAQITDRQNRYIAALETVNPTDMNIQALQVLSHRQPPYVTGVWNDRVCWMPNSFVGVVISALSEGVGSKERKAQEYNLASISSHISYIYSREHNEPIANSAIEQLRPLLG